MSSIPEYLRNKYPDQRDAALRSALQRQLLWAGLSRRGSKAEILLADGVVVAVVEQQPANPGDDRSLEDVIRDIQLLTHDLVFARSKWAAVSYAEILVESNGTELLRLEAEAPAWWPNLVKNFIKTGIVAVLANVLVRLADQTWSWRAVAWGLVAAMISSILVTLAEIRDVEEVLLRGIQ